MPYKYGKSSKRRLATCDPALQDLMNSVLEVSPVDISILCGHRDKDTQDEAFRKGYSTLKFPFSKHNYYPSRAVDVAPYPIDWEDLSRFKELSKVIKDCAKCLDIEIEWGGDWKTFKDYPHWQLHVK